MLPRTQSPAFADISVSSHKVEIVTVEASDVAPVAYLRIQEASLGEPNPELASYSPRAPPLLEDTYEAFEDAVGDEGVTGDVTMNSSGHEDPDLATNVVIHGATVTPGPFGQADWTSISNVSIRYDVPPSIEEECTECWNTVQSQHAMFHPLCQMGC